MDEKKTYLVNVESNLKKYADEAVEAKKKVDELAAANNALKQSGEATTAEIEASNAALRNAQKEYNQAKKMVDLQTAANKSEIGSRKQLGEILKLQEQELGKLGKAYITNAQGMRVLNPLYIEQRNRIAETKKAIIDYDQSLNDGRSNVGRYAESLGQFFKGGKVDVQKYGEAVKGAFKENMGAKISGMIGPMALVTAAITLAVKIFGKLKDAIMSTSGAMNAANIVGQMLKQTFYDIAVNGKLSAESMAAAAEAAKLMNEKRVGDRKDMIEFAMLEREISKLEFDAADKTKTRAERQEALNQAINKQNELSDKKIADAREDLRITQDLMALRPKDDKLKQQEAENIKKIIDLDRERFEQSKRNQAKLTGFEQEMIDARKKLWDDYYAWLDKENERKEKEAEQVAQKEVADEIAGHRQYERLKKEQTNKGKLVEKDKKEQMGLFDMFKKLQKETADIAKETNKDLGDSDTTLTNMKLDNQELIRDSLFNGLDAMISIVGQQTEAGKAFAVAQATIDTFGAANKALNDPTIPSTIARVLIMASIILKGIANVKQILSVKVSKGSASVPSAPTAITSTPAVEKTYAASVGSSFATQPQLSQAQLNAAPNQSLLTADDIARALSKMPAPVVTVEDINAKINQVNKVKVRADI